MRILCADDEQVLLEMMTEFLHRMEHTVVTALDGQQALDAIMQEPDGFDLLISDERMPGVSGMELVERLREQGCGIPIILISGHNDAEMNRKALEYGVIDVLAKPFSLASLKTALDGLES